VGESGGLHFIVMEHLEGEPLDEILQRRGKLPPEEAVRLLHQALLGLEHIHQQGLVHRDLKPSNLMLVSGRGAEQAENTRNDTLKVLDIGLARSLFDETGEANAELTATGTLLGTPDYMAPEQARDARMADIRSDIYSLGCVLYRALTGQPPFPDKNLINQMIRHATETARPLKEFNPVVPDGLQQIVDWMLAKEPAQRYATPARAAQALQVFLAAGTQAAAPEPDASLSSYLLWLQEVNGQRTVEAPKPVPAVPRVEPVPPPHAPAVAVPEAAPAKKHGTRRRGRKHKRPAVSMAAPAKPVLDVELVPLPTPPAEPAPPAGLRLGRRDFLAFGAGAISVLLAILLGWLVAVVVRKKPPAEKHDAQPQPQ
jgi:serine/threonine protein kinase